MARKLRLEYPGAIYHVINRGNSRSWMFKDAGAKESFQQCVFGACERYGWVLHAYVIMGNHYHLAVETPAGNLIAGMQWLQATFANRFKRIRQARGHLFQGRYKALVVEPGSALGQLCHYIHLNPVRAGVTALAGMQDVPFGSLWYLKRVSARPPFLQVQSALSEAGELPDTAAGHRSYLEYLAWQSENGPAGRNRSYATLSKGWAIGSAAFKRDLLREHQAALHGRAWDSQGVRAAREAHWSAQFEAAERALPKRERHETKKSAAWKVAVASYLKGTSDAPNRWLADRLQMGSAAYVSKHVGLARQPNHPATPLIARIREKVRGET